MRFTFLIFFRLYQSYFSRIFPDMILSASIRNTRYSKPDGHIVLLFFAIEKILRRIRHFEEMPP